MTKNLLSGNILQGLYKSSTSYIKIISIEKFFQAENYGKNLQSLCSARN